MKGIYFVESRCVGCEECVVRCEKAHDWEARAFVTIADGYFPFPVRCHHCQEAPCKAVCPTNALQRNEFGAIVADTTRCIGCGSCAAVCPFGVLWVSPKTGKVVKCDLCSDRLAQGLEPSCVVACAKKAIQFGELEEPAQLRRMTVAQQVKAALGV